MHPGEETGEEKDPLVGSAFGSDRIERRLSSDRFRSCYLLESGRWLLSFPTPPQLTEEAAKDWLSAVRGLVHSGHPNLVPYLEATQRDQHFWVLMQKPQAIPLAQFCLEARPNQRLLLYWAAQLSALGSFLVASKFPIGEGFAKEQNLWVRDSQLLMLDPGLGELLWHPAGQERTVAAVQQFGSLLRDLAGEELPANLEWIAARCQAGAGLGYQDFAELTQALHQALIVDVPEVSRPIAATSLPLLSNFTPPQMGKARRFPWGRIFLVFTLLAAAIWGGLSAWYHRPLPPRNYAAAVLTCADGLVFLDLNSGVVRRKLRLSQPVATRRVGENLLVLCRGARRLQMFHCRTLLESRGPAVDPNPDLMVADSSGRWIYLLYSGKARVLLVKLPNTPLAYLDIPSGSQQIQPVSLAGENQPGLLVASQNPGLLQCFSLEKRLPVHSQPLVDIENLAVDEGGNWWVSRAARLERLTPQLKVVQSLPLAAPASSLVAIGPRLLCTQPDGMVILERRDAPTTHRLRLAGEPRKLQPDPSNRNRTWFLQEQFLVCLDLKTGREIRRWPLTQPAQDLTILP